MAEVAELKTGFRSWKRRRRSSRTSSTDRTAFWRQIPNLPLDEVPDGADEQRQCRASSLRHEARLRVHAEAAFRAGRSARPDGFRDRRETLRRAVRRAEERARAAWSARSGSSCSTCIRSEHGYTEVNPPLLVRDEAMFGTAQLPKFEDDQFARPRTKFRPRANAAKNLAVATLDAIGGSSGDSRQAELMQNWLETFVQMPMSDLGAELRHRIDSGSSPPPKSR